jgi:hypothetical protein
VGRRGLLAVLLSAVAGACGGGGDRPAAQRATPTATPTSTAAAPRMPALCTRMSVRIAGRVDVPAATELSGLVASRARPGVFWAHNDSGDSPRLFALRRDGTLLGEVAIAGAEHVDWEDIAIRGRILYVGDIGDNTAQRPEVVVYRLPEPPPDVTDVSVERIALRYPDGAHDAEALLADPRGGALTIVTKSYGGLANVYSGRSATLRLVAKLSLGLGQAITAGDVSADGRVIVLRSYSRAFVWTRRGSESVAAALRREPCVAPADLSEEGQGETLALSRDGRAFTTVPEGPRPALRRYRAG